MVRFIQSDSLLEREVPTLILQPLVENAIIHGIAPQTAGGKLKITIRQSSDGLSIEIVDNGRGIPAERLAKIQAADDQLDDAVGLSNIDGRLQALYGPEYALHIESQETHGTTIQLKIPHNSST